MSWLSNFLDLRFGNLNRFGVSAQASFVTSPFLSFFLEVNRVTVALARVQNLGLSLRSIVTVCECRSLIY